MLSRTRVPIWIGLVILAGMGASVLAVAMAHLLPGHWYGNDLGSLAAPRALLMGHSVHAAYANPARQDGYPLAMELLLTPLAALPDPVRIPFVKTACIGLVLAALLAWSAPKGRGNVAVLMLSMPVLSLAVHDQFAACVALAAFTAAIMAERRGWLVLAGAAWGIAAIRTANALPVAAALLIGAGWDPTRLARLATGAAAVLVPLVGLAVWLDPAWIQDWQANLRHYPVAGIVQLVAAHGFTAVAGAQLLTAVAAGALVWRQRGRPLDLDRSALVLASSTVFAPMDGIYASLFILPAVLRAGGRRGYERIPWITAYGSWIGVVVLAPGLLSPAPAGAFALLTAVVFWLLLNTYPLLFGRRAAQLPAPAPSS